MIGIYGGLWLENLVAQDQHFTLQAELFERGIIQGIQMRVAHPSFTPGVSIEDLPAICARLPGGMPVFIHFGAENVGVDFGETLDECGVFAARGRSSGRSWVQWNAETIQWGKRVAAECTRPASIPAGVVHPGYGVSADDGDARERTVCALRELDDGSGIALENVPALVEREWYAALAGALPITWTHERCWGYGGTPEDMAQLVAGLGPTWRCLIDFTHLVVTRNQATMGRDARLERCRTVGRVLADALALPHWPICHFSGVPPTLMDSSDHMDAPVVEPIRDALRAMEIVCLEVPFRPWSAERVVEDFRARWLDAAVTA